MTSFPQLSNFLFSPRHRRGLSRFGYGDRDNNGPHKPSSISSLLPLQMISIISYTNLVESDS